MNIFTLYGTRVALFTLVFMHAFAIMGNSNASNESINRKKEIQLKTFPVFNPSFPSDSGGFVFDSSFFTNYQKSPNGFPPIWDTPHPSDGIHGILVKLQANPRINNIPIEPGDFIGGFYLDSQNNRKCGGAYFWVDTLDIQFVLFKNDPDTPEKDGFSQGETIQFRFFSWTTMKDYVVDVVGYDTQAYPYTDKWYHLGVSKIINMQALETIDFYISASQNPICTGDMLTLSATEFIGNGGPYTYNWTSQPAGFISNVQYPPAFPISETTTFFLTVTSGSATSNHQLTVTVNDLPETNAGSNGTICSNLGFTVNGTAENFESVLWSTSGDGTFENPSALATTYFAGLIDGNNGSATLTLTANPLIPCTTYSDDDLLLTVIPAPRVNFGPDVTLCTNEIILNSNALYYSSLSWATSGTGTFENTNGPIREYFPSSNDLTAQYVNITVTAQPINGCSGDVSDQVKVSFLPAPTCNAPTSRTKCENQPMPTSGTGSNYDYILWTTSGDGTFVNPSVFSTNYYPGPNDKENGVVLLYLNTYNNICPTPAKDSMIAYIKPLPVINAGPDANIPPSQPFFSPISTISSNTISLLWSSNGDGTWEGKTTLIPKYYPGVNDLANGIVTLTLTGNPISPCSTSISDSMVLTISNDKSVDAGADQSICEVVPVFLVGIVQIQVSSVSWTTSGDGTFENGDNLTATYYPGSNDYLNGQAELTLTVVNAETNQPQTDALVVTIQKNPTSYAGIDATTCQNQPYTLSGIATNYQSVQWSTSGNGNFGSAGSPTTVYTPGTTDITNGTVTLTLTANPKSPCSVSASDALILTIQKSPTPNAGNDASICFDQTHTLSGTAIDHYSVIWTTSGNGTFSSTSSFTPVYTPGTTDITNGSVTLTLTASPLTPCSVSVSDAMILTIHKLPTANAGANSTICQTGTRTLSGSATNYSNVLWTTSGNGTFGSTSSPTTVYTPGTTDINNGTVTLTLTAYPLTPCSVSASHSIIVTIRKSPTANAGDDASICQTQTHPLTGTAQNQLGVQWTTSGNGTFTNGNTLTAVYTPGTTDITNGTVTLTLTATAVSPCTVSVTDTKILTILKSPTANAGTNSTICQTATRNLTGTATNYSSVMWTTSGNGTFGSASSLTTVYTPGTTDITNGTVNLTLTAYPLTPCSVSASHSIIVTVRKAPTANAGNDAAICQTQNHPLSGTAQNQLGVQWTTSGNGTFTNGNTLTAVYNPGTTDITNGSVTLTLTATAISPCTVAATDTKILTIQKSPTANAGVDATICQTDTKTLSGTAANYSSVLWTTSGNGTFSSSNSLTTVYTPGTTDITNGTVNLTLAAYASDPCTGSVSDVMTLTIRKSPTANAGPDATICQTGTKTLSGTATNYSSVLWTTSGNGSFSSASSLTTVYSPGTNDISNGMVTLTLTANPQTPCSVSVSDAMILTLQRTPTANAGDDATICQNQTHSLTGTAQNQLGVQWTTSGNGTFTNGNTLTAVYTPGTTDISNGTVTLTLTVTAISPCTVSLTDTKILTIQKSPTANAGTNSTICQTGTRTLSGTANNSSSILWTTSGDGTFGSTTSLSSFYTPGPTDISNGSVTLTLTAYPFTPCSVSASHSIIITIRKAPIANAGNDATICQTQNHPLSGTALNQLGVQWTTSGNGTFTNGNTLAATYYPGPTDISNGTVTLTLTATAISPCTVSAVDTKILTIQKSPTANAGVDVTICETGTRNLSGSATNYSSVLWTTSGNGTFSSTNTLETVYTPGTTDKTNGTVTLTFTALAISPCTVSATDAMILTLRKAPTANAGNDATICQNQTHTLSGSSANNHLSVQWSSSGDGTFTNGNTLTATYNPGTNDKTNSTATLTLSAAAISPCTVAATDFKILTIQQLPIANAGDDVTITGQTNDIYCLIGAFVSNASNYEWATSGTGSFYGPSASETCYLRSISDYNNGSVVLTLTAYAINPCSTSVSDQMMITFVSDCEDAIANAGEDATICSTEPVVLNGFAQNYNSIFWNTQGGDGTFGNSSSLNTYYYPGTNDKLTGSVTLCLTANAGETCEDSTHCVIITITKPPTANAGIDATICQNQIHTLSGTASNYSSILWTSSGNGTFGNPNSMATTYTPCVGDIANGSVTLTLSALPISPCTVPANDFLVLYIQSSPEAVVGEDATVCESDTFTLSGTATSYSNVLWTTSGNGTFIAANTLTPVYTPGTNDIANGTVTLLMTAFGISPCTVSASDYLILTIQKTPTVNAGPNATICQNQLHSMSGIATNYSTILWTSSGNGTFGDPNSMATTYTPCVGDIANGSVTLTLTALPFSPCTVPATDFLILSIQRTPEVLVGEDATVCESETFTLSGAATSYSNVLWTTTGNGTFDTENSLTPVYTPGTNDIANGTVTLLMTAFGISPCTVSASDYLILTIQKTPTAYAGQDASVLKNESYTLADAVEKNSSNIQWSTSGDGAFDDQNDVNATYFHGVNDGIDGSVVLTLLAQPVEPCIQENSDEMTLTISFDCQHAQADAGEDIVVCVDDEILLNGTAANYSSVGWVSSGDGSFENPTDLNTMYLPGTADLELGVVELCLTAYAFPGCDDATHCITLTLFNNPAVELPSNVTMCSSDVSVSLTGNATDFSSLNWTTNGDGTFDDPGLLNPNYFPGVTDRTNGLVTLELAATGFNNCGTASGSLILTFAPEPEINISLTETSLCYGDDFDLTGLVTGSNYSEVQWFTTNGGGYYSDEYSLTPIYYPSPTVDYPQGCIELYVVAAAIYPCSVSAEDAITLCFQAPPSVNAGFDETICGNSNLQLSATASDFSGLEWLTNGDGYFDQVNITNPVYYPGNQDIANETVSLTFIASPILPCVNPVADELILTIQPGPMAYAGEDASILMNESYTLADAATKNSSTIQWSTSGDGSFDDQTFVNATYFHGTEDGENGSVTLSLYVQPIEPCMQGILDEITLTISVDCQHAQADAGEDISACIDDEILLNGTTLFSSLTIWETNGDGSFENPNDLNTRYLPGATDLEMGIVDLCLTAYALPGCEDSTNCITLTIFKHPTVELPSNVIMCSSDVSVSLTGNATDFYSLNWITNGDGTFDDPGLLNPYYFPGENDRTTGLVTLDLAATGFNNCGSASGSTILTFAPDPEINISLTETSICYGDEFDFAGLVTGTNYSEVQWFTTNGGGYYSDEYSITPIYYPSPTVDYPQGCIELYVVAAAIYPCSVSDDDAINLCFQGSPTVNAGEDQTICDDIQFTNIQGDATNYSSLDWQTSGDGTFVGQNQLLATYYPGFFDRLNGFVTLSLSANGNSNCSPAFDDVDIIISPSPIAIAGPDQLVKVGKTVMLDKSEIKNDDGCLWETSGDGSFTDSLEVVTEYHPGQNDNTNLFVTLYLTAYPIDPCNTPDVDEIDITFFVDCINPTVFAGNDTIVCMPGDVLLSGTAQYYESVLWTTNGDGYFENETSLETRYYPGSLDQITGNVELTLKAEAADECEDAFDSLILTILQSPEVNAGADISICKTQTFAELSGIADNYLTTQWYTSGNGTFSDEFSLFTYYYPGINDINTGNVTITLTANGENCGPVSDQLIIAITNTPTANAGVDATICQTNNRTLTGTATNYASVLWTTSGNGTFSSTGSLTTVYTPGTTDIANGTVTLTLTANAQLPCVGSVSDAMILTIRKSPTANAGIDATICQNQNHPLSGTATNQLGVLWSTSGNGTFTNGNTLNAVYNPGAVDIANGSVTLTLTATAISPCTVSSVDTKILIIQKLSTANAGADATICQTETINLSGMASNYSSVQWTTSGNGTFSSTGSLTAVYTPGTIDITNGTVNLTLTANAQSPCVVSATDFMVLTIQKSPTANSGADATICQTGTINLSGTASNYSSVLWTTSGNGTFGSASSLATVYTPGNTDISNGTVTLTMTANAQSPCTVSVADAMILTIRKSPTVNAGTDATICQTGTHQLNGTASDYLAIQWFTTGNGSFSNSGILNPVYSPGADDISTGSVILTFTASPVSPCLAVASDEMQLQIQKSPNVFAGIDATICQTGTYNLTGVASHYSSVLWSTSGNGTFASTGSLSTVYTPGNNEITNGSVTLTLTVNAQLPCTVSTSDALILTIQKSPTANAGADATICQTQTKTLSGTAANYATILWTTTGNGTFSSASSLAAVYTPGSTDISNGLVTLTLTANALLPCSGSVSDALVLTIQKSPTANAGVDATICQTETKTLSGTATNYSTILWTTSGNGTFSSASSLTTVYTPGSTDISIGSATLTLTANASSPCSGSVSDAMILTIQKSPTTNAGVDATVCQIQTKTLSGTATNYSTVLWTTTGNGTFSSTSSLTTVYTPGNSDINNGSVTLTLTANAQTPCTVSVSDAMILNIQKSPTAFAGANASILFGQNYLLADANAQYAAQTLWQTSGTGTFDSVNVVNTRYYPSEADYLTGSVILTLTADPVNPCLQNVYDNMVLSFSANCIDAIAYAGEDFAVCTPSVVNLNGSAVNSTGILWTTSGNGTFGSAISQITVYTPGTMDIANGSVTLTLTAYATAPCADDTDEVVVEFINQPGVNVGNNQMVCLPDATLVSGSAQNTASTLWETNGDGTFGDATALTTIYYPGTLDLQTKIVTLCLTATGNTPCGYMEDCLTVTYNQKPVPNAGNDVTVCYGTDLINLYGSATNYTSFAWSTTGDGQFLPSNNTTLTPKYKPGVGDKANGLVNIILSATNSMCGTQKDTMQITILHDAFAYAGEDATICGNEFYTTTNAFIENAESILWETNGDGTFDNPNEVLTNYHPGFVDNQTGYVILCLTANAFGNCPDDTWCLTLTLNTSAYVNAGNDTGICDDQTVQVNAVGSNFNSLLWVTTGDGTFNQTNILNPVYTPGSLDLALQQVSLIVTAISSGDCGNSTDTLNVEIGHIPIANAGIDETLCENESISLEGQVQYQASILWMTSGDGTFDNVNLVDPVYYPGAVDIENGSVVLTLTVLGNSPCNITVSDEVNISIQRIPDVNAGVDYTICQEESYQLSGTALFYHSISWITNGDGTFSETNILNPVYTPGVEDIQNGWAKITLQAASGSPCNITSADIMYVVIDRFPEIILDLEDMEAQMYSNVFLVIGALDGEEYQWYGPDGLIPGADGSLLELYNVDSDDAGYYYCSVSNGCGTNTSHVMYLDVYENQYISMPMGWAGMSSFIEPKILEVEHLFEPVTSQLISLENFSGCYLPGVLNTLFNYDPQDGYKAKFNQATIVEIRGSTNMNRTVTLNQGWNYLPVICSCPVSVAELFGGNTKVQIIKEIAGMGIYWPSVGINTINDMLPGRAYFIRASESFSITYPECPETKSSIITADMLKAKNNSLWNDIIYTPITHIVALDAGLYEILKPGDILGAFTPMGLCSGYLEIDGSWNGISLFGDDPLTLETDGFVDGDLIRFKVYRPGTGEEFDLNVSYDLSYPNYNGQFLNYGMSGIMKSETTNLSISDITTSKLTIYPNPTSGRINILGLSNNSKIEICNTEGQLLKTINCTNYLQNEGTVFNFDLSGFTPGVVFFRIIEPDKVEIRKIILQ